MTAPVSFHIKIRRDKTTYFIECSQNETIGSVKQKLSSIINKPYKEFRLAYKDQSQDDEANLSSLGIGLDDTLALCYWISDEADVGKGKWEQAHFENYPNLAESK
ncbi:hypothetical protein O9G_003288 [Rozella allomycis CSF55]|uniref:Ubiquitin-like domain-containing protein n=1 Tax=Rozella allomycis (strain CSF55) TaxID=988480 RepID=A0A075B425_ROZAC|nr:hypothetical protein O9G_003288 [Rozella allomycis CSF55]|eukprot:EPZ35804.1 hypothetical protein O9G_003288 [Rozella allomycis CSF55]